MAAKTTKEKNPLPKHGRFYEITFQDTMGLSFRGLFGFPKEDKEFLIEAFDCFFNHTETRNRRVQEILMGINGDICNMIASYTQQDAHYAYLLAIHIYETCSNKNSTVLPIARMVARNAAMRYQKKPMLFSEENFLRMYHDLICKMKPYQDVKFVKITEKRFKEITKPQKAKA